MQLPIFHLHLTCIFSLLSLLSLSFVTNTQSAWVCIGMWALSNASCGWRDPAESLGTWSPLLLMCCFHQKETRAGERHRCEACHILFAVIMYSLKIHTCRNVHICLNTIPSFHVQTVFPISSQSSKTPSHSFSSLWFRRNCPSKTTLAQLISHWL